MMKNVFTLSMGLAVVSAISFTGCKKESSTLANPKFSFALQSDNPLVALASDNTGSSVYAPADLPAASTASVTWTTATANVSKFKLEAKQDGKAFELSANGISNLDLLAVNPATINTVIPNGTYKEIELSVTLVKSSGTAYPLVLKGNFKTKAGNIIPIEFDFNDDAVLKASASDLVIDGTKDILAKVNLHLNKILASVTASEIDATARTGNNTILISSSVNATLYNKIKVALYLSGESEIHKSEHTK